MSMADRDGFIWQDGKLVPWREATTHVLTHSLHYGLAVFEGVRAYKTPAGTAIFRLKEHTDRLFNSAKVFMMEIPYSREQLMDAMYQDERIVSDRTVDSHIKKLRRKIEDCMPGQDLIHSVYGLGYRFDPPPQPPTA